MTPPLVLLPGMMCDGRLFSPQIKALSDEREVVVGDLAGAADMGGLAEAVLSNAPQRFALAGLSMGGIVAMEIVARAPDRVERLALLDTNPRAELPEVKARRAPQIAAVRAGGLERVMREELKPNYLADGPHRAEILEVCMAMALDLGPEVFARQSLALRDRPDRQDALRAVRVPTLILCGALDALCPVERHELMHALVPGSRLVVVEGAGHMPTLERPEETTAALARWLAD
ncbi:alpha/beta fold hydrolase [Roseibacterium sp. SDUM158017]|uniref:alpha/beta fold hydrolase n=1 Tax=Roseicyclus salinarum TaxID=3036773 RepID=UPI002415478C|nr:alpha/beta fold hydrolase [Roseibacterium sp. SDUM158017]MDG4649661.1 alpha/beta fold hydrolase [Roseibacterium sp. SDUM158017]